MCSQDGSLLPMVSLACYVPRDIQAKVLTSSRVGGIVSETNFKFFLQFVSYASIYWLHVLVFMAVYVAEVKSEVSGFSSGLSHNQGCASAGFVGEASPYLPLNQISAVSSTCRGHIKVPIFHPDVYINHSALP